MTVRALVFFICSLPCLLLAAPDSKRLAARLGSLNPYSISEQLAFYELYPQTAEGQRALARVFSLLGTTPVQGTSCLDVDKVLAFSIIHLVNRCSSAPAANLTHEQLQLIERLGTRLGNRSLKGYAARTEAEVIALPSCDIDLARGMLLSQLPDSENKMLLIRQYEAFLDLMALQILGYLQPYGGANAPLEKKIEQINHLIFKELHFRFPPQSASIPDIDLYTFLPSVLDTRRGVCLGVSMLYLALAQRLNIPLEIVTPPGHIYLRCKIGSKFRNIETTARGVDYPCETYLGIDTRALQTRNTKETIGMAHFNQASVYSQMGDYQKAVECYRKAEKYLVNDLLLQELLAYHLIFSGDEKAGRQMLIPLRGQIPEESVSASSTIEDYLDGKVDGESIKSIFIHVDETRESIVRKQQILEQVLEKFPAFRDGITQLATTWIQLKRDENALTVLRKYHQLDDTDPTVEYYLAVLFCERADYKQAWKHLHNCTRLTAQRDHHPKALKELQHALRELSPE